MIAKKHETCNLNLWNLDFKNNWPNACRPWSTTLAKMAVSHKIRIQISFCDIEESTAGFCGNVLLRDAMTVRHKSTCARCSATEPSSLILWYHNILIYAYLRWVFIWAVYTCILCTFSHCWEGSGTACCFSCFSLGHTNLSGSSSAPAEDLFFSSAKVSTRISLVKLFLRNSLKNIMLRQSSVVKTSDLKKSLSGAEESIHMMREWFNHVPTLQPMQLFHFFLGGGGRVVSISSWNHKFPIQVQNFPAGYHPKHTSKLPAFC